MLSEKCANTAYDGDTTRIAHIFPSPTSKVYGATGSFKLVEDDGKSNDHVEKGAFTELELSFQVAPGEKDQHFVEVDVKTLKDSYALPYEIIWFVLPPKDKREIRLVSSSAKKTSTRKADDGRTMLGVHVR